LSGTEGGILARMDELMPEKVAPCSAVRLVEIGTNEDMVAPLRSPRASKARERFGFTVAVQSYIAERKIERALRRLAQAHRKRFAGTGTFGCPGKRSGIGRLPL
jgi:hypothetical protein